MSAMDISDIKDAEEIYLANFLQNKITACLKISVDLKTQLERLQKTSSVKYQISQRDDKKEALKAKILRKRRDLVVLKSGVNELRTRIHGLDDKTLKDDSTLRERSNASVADSKLSKLQRAHTNKGLEEILYQWKCGLVQSLGIVADEEDITSAEETTSKELARKRTELATLKQQKDKLFQLIRKVRYLCIRRVLTYVFKGLTQIVQIRSLLQRLWYSRRIDVQLQRR